jgi:hypothetical protein
MMNGDSGEIQEKSTQEKDGDTNPPAPVTHTAESKESGTKSAGERKETANLEQISRWSRFKEWLSKITVAEVGMLLLTVAIAGSSIVYTKYAKRQWRVMRDTLALERPWLGPSGRDVRTIGPKQLPEGKPIDWSTNHLVSVIVRVVNGGRTPATKIRWHMLFKIGEKYDAANETATTNLPTDGICEQGQLGPEFGSGMMLPNPEHYTNFPVYPDADILKRFDSDIVTNNVGLYIVGCFDYSDSSGKPWYRSRIRLVFAPNQADMFDLTRYGNEAW